MQVLLLTPDGVEITDKFSTDPNVLILKLRCNSMQDIVKDDYVIDRDGNMYQIFCNKNSQDPVTCKFLYKEEVYDQIRGRVYFTKVGKTGKLVSLTKKDIENIKSYIEDGIFTLRGVEQEW